MTSYCDASVIVAALTAEPFSLLARRWLDDQPGASLVQSGWTLAEVDSALARKQRSRRLDAVGRARALATWRTVSQRIALTDVVPADFALVASLVDSGPGLRAGDALHLAVVLRLGVSLATFDRDLATAARAEGVRVALAPPTLDERSQPPY